ncbi:unnamed protein product [Scytosiphon promiscuus]
MAWAALLSGAIVWLVGVVASTYDRRDSPPVRISKKVEPYGFPDVAICPTSGGGCDAEDPSLCSEGMRLFVSALVGFEDDEDDFAATLATSSPTPTPPATAAPATETAPALVASESGSDAASSPQLLLAAMMDTTAHSWCPVVPLSTLTVDWDGVDSGDVRSLHASIYVLWSDEVAETPVSNTRQFINTFLVGGGTDENGDAFGAEDATVLSRLPYDRISSNGSSPTTFVSNDVIVGLTQHVSLEALEDTGSTTARMYTQVATTSQHTLTLDDAEPFTGAILYVTFSINDFAFHSIEEFDPVEYWTLVGAAGGVLALLFALFGLLFVPGRTPGPRRHWRFSSQRRKRRRSKLDFRTNLEGNAATAAQGTRRQSI